MPRGTALSRVLWLCVRRGLCMRGRRVLHSLTHELQANQLFSQTGQEKQNKGEMERKDTEACGSNERSG